MKKYKHCFVYFIALVSIFGCASHAVGDDDTGRVIDLGDPQSERIHNVVAENAGVISYNYPDRWIVAVRGSAHEEGCEPYRVFDGNKDTHWEFRGPTPFAASRLDEHWIGFDLNRDMALNEISVRWLGDDSYRFRIHAWTRSDGTAIVYEGESEGQSEELETYTFPASRSSNAFRIDIVDQDAGDDSPRGIKEVRVGGLSWPDSYPQAAHPNAPVHSILRPLYYGFQRHPFDAIPMEWEQFNLKRTVADGGTARQIASTKEFEGGHIDFDIAVDPQEQNWVTLKIWESHSELMTERGNSIALEAYAEDPDRNRRWFLPRYMMEEKKWNRDWYGLAPEPGRWVYASYAIHRDITEGQTRIRLRLQGIGNDRRDHPMLSAAPPVYSIYSNSGAFPAIVCEKGK